MELLPTRGMGLNAMRELFSKLFLEDLALKAIALFLAIVLVFLVRTELEATTALLVRVQYTPSQGRVLISEKVPPEQVKVVVRGPWGRVSRASQEVIEPIRITLNDYADSDLRFSAEMLHMPAGLRIESFDPPVASLRFATEATMVLPVQLTTEGQLAEGYRLKKTTIAPPTVKVRGAMPVLETLRNLQTRPLHIAGLTGTTTVTIDLGPLPMHVAFVDSPPPRIQIEAIVELVEKRLPNLRVQSSSGSPQIKLSPEAVSVVLRGQGLEKLQELPILTVDTVSDERKPAGFVSMRRVQVTNLPPGIAYEVTPREVEVSVIKPPPPGTDAQRKQPELPRP